MSKVFGVAERSQEIEGVARKVLDMSKDPSSQVRSSICTAVRLHIAAAYVACA